ncbi:unnamed protein product [Musa hybrid cultivar]
MLLSSRLETYHHLTVMPLTASTTVECRWKRLMDLSNSSSLQVTDCGMLSRTNEEAVVAIVKPLQDPEQAAKKLLQEAYQRGSSDNITWCRGTVSWLALITQPSSNRYKLSA